ncbi:hypothetical protein DJ568_16745 [Mucilaginibacter hurinus]|uniref:Uncharacterized protein n=1 Tax=Mucilaginibacter hurinus TaxID=2201324 RepID=A0A367GLW8_9SPHI|nr:hypothetical protein DJ568_16745 [Mucilaginibacter hurinus]
MEQDIVAYYLSKLIEYKKNVQIALPELIINNVRERSLYIEDLRKDFAEADQSSKNVSATAAYKLL